MNKRFLAFMAVLFLGIFSLYAVPAQRSFKTYQQPDGSTITLSLQGDEFGHWYVTPDNRIHKKLGNGQFVPCSPVEIADLKQQRQEAIRRVWDGDSEIQKSSPRRAGQSRHPKAISASWSYWPSTKTSRSLLTTPRKRSRHTSTQRITKVPAATEAHATISLISLMVSSRPTLTSMAHTKPLATCPIMVEATATATMPMPRN